MKALSQVRAAIIKFFKLNSWQEAETKFGASVHPERLLRFKGDFEKLYEFKMFLKHLKQKIEQTDTDYADTNYNSIVGPDGVTRGHVVFIKQHEDMDQNSGFLESGAFLSIAHVGYTAQDVVSEIKDVVDLVVRINFKRLMTIFNIVFICPVGVCCKVQETVSLKGAAKTQCGFIVNKIPPLAREDLLMTEVVECFVVCHWAVSCNKLTERHVSRAATNVIEVIRDGLCQPRELYESLIETFSKEGDLILDIGSANGNGMLAAVQLKRPSVLINEHTREDLRWHLLENIKEKNLSQLE
ncbi:uncharacterized protein [Acropora muricata]|uniref:uncharacterized protein n=1 Tax=Acropora muricata TaxID=159855 RepID=UPI0034E3F353